LESSIHNEENKNKRNEKKKTAEGASEADIRDSIRRRQHSMKTEQRCGRVAKVEVVKKKKKKGREVAEGAWQWVVGGGWWQRMQRAKKKEREKKRSEKKTRERMVGGREGDR